MLSFTRVFSVIPGVLDRFKTPKVKENENPVPITQVCHVEEWRKSIPKQINQTK